MKRKVYVSLIGVIFLAMILILYSLYVNRTSLWSAGKGYMVDRLAGQLVDKLPEDYDKTEARAAIKEYLIASTEQRLRGERTEEVGELFGLMVKGQKLTREEADQLMEAIRESIRKPESEARVLGR